MNMTEATQQGLITAVVFIALLLTITECYKYDKFAKAGEWWDQNNTVEQLETP